METAPARDETPDELREILNQFLEELEDYPLLESSSCADEQLELQTGHPLCDLGRRLVKAIPDSKRNRKGSPNFPGRGGKLWYRLLRVSRTTRDETLLEQTGEQLADWIRQHYNDVLSGNNLQDKDNSPMQPPVDFVIVTPLREECGAVLDLLENPKRSNPVWDNPHVYFTAQLPTQFPDGECKFQLQRRRRLRISAGVR